MRELFWLFLLLLLPISAQSRTTRLVLIKVDGLPYEKLNRFVMERDPHTGKSQLPWVEHIFYRGGTRLENFYVRGLSLSAPSWSLLDTGEHLQIKGNVEYDRYTGHVYDYLGFIPFYLQFAALMKADMPGVETLDELNIPLFQDNFPYSERHTGFQLFQRGTRWTTLQRSIGRRFNRNVKELIDEWTIGFDNREMISDQLEAELIEKINNPKIRYLDHYISDYDHIAHHNRDRESHLEVLKEIDSFLGRVWTAIQKSSLRDTTALIVVSDHGTNSNENVYSQGYNLVNLLSSREGGGHHVATKRRLMVDYAIKGVYPLVPLVTNTSVNSYYLKGMTTRYPTALFDFDGNERATIHLRNSDINLLHILLIQLKSSGKFGTAVKGALFDLIDSHRLSWSQTVHELEEELSALRQVIEKQRIKAGAHPRKFTKEEQDAGRDKEAIRDNARLQSFIIQEKSYSEYLASLRSLLALDRTRFRAEDLKIEDLIHRRSMGDPNSIYNLQNYVAGISDSGLKLKEDGSLDLERSFTRIDYLKLLKDRRVRNNVQKGVGSIPVDFIATRIPTSLLNLEETDLEINSVWLYAGELKQALVLSRRSGNGLQLKYMPVSGLKQNAAGLVSFQRIPFTEGLPLKIWEDIKHERTERFLSEWHTEAEWFKLLHQTRYSNGLISLHEQFARHEIEHCVERNRQMTRDERLLCRFRMRQRRLTETDLSVFAQNHWNFDVRGFNPGGNHGSFLRVSTHSTLMFAGGVETRIPQGLSITHEYDSLSFVPTLLKLMGLDNRHCAGRAVSELVDELR